MVETAPDKSRILLVEDNPGDALLLTELLAEVGNDSFDVVQESTLEAALQRLDKEVFSAVILDLALPMRKVIGGLSDQVKVLIGLDIQRVEP